MDKIFSDVVTDGRYLLDRYSRWLAFSPTLVITTPGPPDIGYITCYLYGCSLPYCIRSNFTCNRCPYVLGFQSNLLTL